MHLEDYRKRQSIDKPVRSKVETGLNEEEKVDVDAALVRDCVVPFSSDWGALKDADEKVCNHLHQYNRKHES